MLFLKSFSLVSQSISIIYLCVIFFAFLQGLLIPEVSKRVSLPFQFSIRLNHICRRFPTSGRWRWTCHMTHWQYSGQSEMDHLHIQRKLKLISMLVPLYILRPNHGPFIMFKINSNQPSKLKGVETHFEHVPWWQLEYVARRVTWHAAVTSWIVD